jgi:hypothetical protein
VDDTDVGAPATATLTSAEELATQRSRTALSDLQQRMRPPHDAPDGVLSFTSSPHGTIEGIWGPDLAQDLPSHDTRSPVARSQAYLTRPDDWTNTVELPALVGSPSWFVLHGGPLLGSTLSRFTVLLHGSEYSAVRQRVKGGE